MSDTIKDQISYNPETGEFIWLVKKSNKFPGDVAGHLNNTLGYRTVMLDYKVYYAHHLALWFMTGNFPPKGSVIDHINGDKADNRWENLRLTNQVINGHNRKNLNKNNKSGATGIFQCRSGKWVSKIWFNRQQIFLGTFTAKDEAIAAREAFRAQNGLR